MPNWCYNELRVSGPAKALARFEAQAKEVSPPAPTQTEPNLAVFSFQSLVPMPPAAERMPSQPADRDWRRRHWGCQSGALRTVLLGRTPNGGVSYEFVTAWSPPLPFLRAVSERWSSLVFLDFEEPRMGFKGLARAAAGSMQSFSIDL